MIDNQQTRRLCDINAMKILEQIIIKRKRLELIERRLMRQASEIYDLNLELAKMSTEIARLKTSQNKKEAETHGREQDPAR